MRILTHLGRPFALAALVCGCSHYDRYADAAPPDVGKEGALSFDDMHCYGQGCSLVPFMIRSTGEIELTPAQSPDIVATSTDEGVFSAHVALRSEALVGEDGSVSQVQIPYVAITTLAAGTGELRITTATGALLDRIDVTVEAPAQLTFYRDGDTTPTAAVSFSIAATAAPNTPAPEVRVVPVDGDGKPLSADEGFAFTSSDPSTLVLSSCVLCFVGDGANVWLHGIAAGGAAIDVAAGGMSASIPVTVQP